MALRCAITGDVPKVAVISPKSGAVFEKTVIEKHVASAGTDPINDEPLDVSELIQIQAPEFNVPRAPAATSLPSLLKTFQDEWDAAMLETFELKRENHKLTQELTQSLYQHDAATRVIARLIKERDQARQALESLQASGVAPANNAAPAAQSEAMDASSDESASGLSPEVVARIDQTFAQLSQARRKREKNPEGLATPEQIGTYKQQEVIKGVHSSRSGNIHSLSYRASDNMLLTSSSDKTAALYNLESKEVVAHYKGHGKKVLDARLHPTADVAVTGSADNHVKIWTASTGENVATLEMHSQAVNNVNIHPEGQLVVSCSDDGSWAVSDIATQSNITLVNDAKAKSIKALRVHPDGAILGAGNESSTVGIWDIRTAKCEASFEGHGGAVTSLAFSENGYHMATGGIDSTVRFWDLRKLNAFHTLEFDAGHEVNSVAFDHSGQYCAVGGSDVRVYMVKKWSELVKLEEHKKAVAGVAWAPNAQSIFSAGADSVIMQHGF
ncbi:uncharacterized protein MONBRDRAFT_34443 [Monosiga brevicollis MX1]|uniref:Pre-mRNA-processing factor 19 n=1 Tax=Monosiga brevicollis TaxID=81824 RepID=A9VBT4_MONBE|nr:uncharacterized protein MONBRDRAFT_34443 [Monosiga brevicollis MX1]EDQ84987.1 predicted protein [Monosiga brevicollis MX1]|eukprot:XP_001750157.1 hypothetical protein [Monosiga brevicollis MX1]